MSIEAKLDSKNLDFKLDHKQGMESIRQDSKKCTDSRINRVRKKGISRLLELSGEKSFTLIFSSILSGLSAMLQFVPYFVSYLIVREFVINSHDLSNVNRDYVMLCGLWAIGSIILFLICTGVSFVLSHFAAYRILYNIRLALLEHLARLPLGYFSVTTRGEILQNLQENVKNIENFIAHKIPEFLMTIIGATAIFVVFLWVDWRLGLICIGTYIVALVIQFSIYQKSSIKEEIKRFYGMQEQINTHCIELVSGIKVIKLFNKSASSISKLASSVQAYKDYSLSFVYKCMPTYLTFNVIVNCFIFFILPLSAFLVADNPLDVIPVLTIIFFVMMSNGLVAPLLKVLSLSSYVMQINEGVERIDKVFATKPLPSTLNPKKPRSFDIEFKNVCFSHDNESMESSLESKQEQTLNNISFTLKQGEHLVMVGESGGGKSTILSLMARFYDVSSGSITIGGVDVRDIDQKDLMDTLSLVFQDSFLFMDTLRENIRVGYDIESKGDLDSLILNAAHLAQCDEIIAKYGLDATLGIGGIRLSGGEAQRINIARAILKNAPILLLDEITSGLDAHNENAINKAIHNLTKEKNKTIIMITHKLNVAKYANKVALIHKGNLIDFGTHDELLQRCLAYKSLWDAYTDTQTWHIRN